MQPSRAAAVDLHWIPFDAGGHFVSFNGRVFEANETAHALGLAETIELARTIDRLPAQLMASGIEEEDLRAGDELSAARAAVGAVRLELRERLVTS